MKLKLGVVGNRTGWTYARVLTNINAIREDFRVEASELTIISGGAIGVDEYAQQYAKDHGIKLIIFYPSPLLKVPEKYYERNFKIADECDILLAFNKKARSGTQNTIKFANKLGKKVVVIDV